LEKEPSFFKSPIGRLGKWLMFMTYVPESLQPYLFGCGPDFPR
jgi:hypothetical protein